MRRYAALSVIALAGGGFLFQSGCAEQKPKPVTQVSPPIAPKAGAGGAETKPADGTKSSIEDGKTTDETKPVDEDKKPVEPVEEPTDAGSTTGGGTDETPSKGSF